MFIKCALNLAEDGRILSAWDVLPNGKYDGMPIVDILPTGETEEEQDIHNWLYQNGEYVYAPLPDPTPVVTEPTTEEILNAMLGVE